MEATALGDWFGSDWAARAAEEVAHAALNNRPILDGPTFKEYGQSRTAARVALESLLARGSVEHAQSAIEALRKENAELLAALEAMLPIFDAFTQDELSVTTIKEAQDLLPSVRAAIAKATGK